MSDLITLSETELDAVSGGAVIQTNANFTAQLAVARNRGLTIGVVAVGANANNSNATIQANLFRSAVVVV